MAEAQAPTTLAIVHWLLAMPEADWPFFLGYRRSVIGHAEG